MLPVKESPESSDHAGGQDLFDRSALIRMLLVVVVIAVGIGVYLERPSADADTAPGAETSANLPRLVDLGADKCANCKKMMPILAALDTEFEGRFEVEFIDVWKNPDASATYGIRVIPTQIFFAADGTELFRHEGFYGREDILGKWNELGIDLGPDAG